jgi:pyruvate dehydrogenase kinase 2/3/4
MRRMLVSRISRRVLAEHHIALSETLAGRRGESLGGEPHVGVIYTGLDVKRSIDKCAELLRGRPHHIEDGFGDDMINTQWPEVVVDGHVSTKFPYIREHLEYVSNLLPVLLSAVVIIYS